MQSNEVEIVAAVIPNWCSFLLKHKTMTQIPKAVLGLKAIKTGMLKTCQNFYCFVLQSHNDSDTVNCLDHSISRSRSHESLQSYDLKFFHH